MRPEPDRATAKSSSAGIRAELFPRAIVDNSVWQRAHMPRVKESIGELIRAGIEVVTCAPQLLEVLWSARNSAEHDELLSTFGAYRNVEPVTGFTETCARLHSRLWASGRVRAVGNSDIQIAVIALQNGCTVIHYDSDFEFVEAAEPHFSHRWIAARGSLPN